MVAAEEKRMVEQKKQKAAMTEAEKSKAAAN